MYYWNTWQAGWNHKNKSLHGFLASFGFQQSEAASFQVSEFVCVMELPMLPQQPVLNCCHGNKSIDV